MKRAALLLALCGCSTVRVPASRALPDLGDPAKAPPLDYRLVTQTGHTTSVRAMATSASGLLAITASRDGEVRVWETDAGRVVRALRSGRIPARSVAISGDDALVAVGDEAGGVVVWELESGRELWRAKIHDRYVEGLAFHGTDLGSVGGDGILDVRPARGGGTPKRTEPEPAATVNGAAASFDGSKFVVSIPDHGVEVWGIDGRVIDAYTGVTDTSSVAMSRDARTVVATTDSRTHYLFRRGTPTPVMELRSTGHDCAGVAVSEDGTRAAIGCTDGSIDLFDLATGTKRPLTTWKDGDPSVNDVWGLGFTRDDKRLFATIESEVGIWNLETVTRLSSARPAIPISSVRVDGDRAIVIGPNGTQVWQLDELRMIEGEPVPGSPGGASRFAVAIDPTTDGVFTITANGNTVRARAVGADWVVWSDDGYFDGNRGGLELLAAARGGRAWYADQVGLAGNRPDVLMARLGIASQLRDHFTLRARARRGRAGAMVSSDAAPELVLGDIVVAPGGTAATITARAAAARGLARLHVRVNGVPVFGSGGKPIAGGSLDITERIPLAPGNNRIEVGVADANGLDSMRAVRTVVATRGSKPRLVFVGFGISHYRQADLDLAYADKDVLDLERLVTSMTYALPGGALTRTYTNERVTREAWTSATTFVAQTTVDDVLVVLLSGHGAYSERDGNYYFLTHDSKLDDLEHTAMPYAALEALVEAAPARRRLVLIDTCQSGELDETLAGAALHVRGAKGVVRSSRERPRGLDESRLIESDLARKTGAIVMSASRGDEPSFEDDSAKNGVFTKSVLDGLGGAADLDLDLQVSTRELLDYVRRTVPQRAQNRQHPTVDRDNPLVEIRIPLKGRP